VQGWLYDVGNQFYLYSNPYMVDMAAFGSEPLLDYSAFIDREYPQSVNHIAITVTNQVWVRWYFKGVGNDTWAYQMVNADLPAGLTFIRGFTNYNSLFLLSTNGSVLALGKNYYGQLGLGDAFAGNDFYTFMSVDLSPLGTERVVDISLGRDFTIFLTNSGRLYATGKNGNGELGIALSASFFSIGIPTAVSTSYNFTSICSTKSSNVGIGTDGMAYVWGYSPVGALGLGSVTDLVLYPTAMWSPGSSEVGNRNASQVVCGDQHVMILTNDGSLFVAGEGTYGALGISPPRTVFNLTLMEPALFAAPFSQPRLISAGYGWGGVLTTAGPVLHTWGNGLGAAGFAQGASYVSAGAWWTTYSPVPISGSYVKISSRYFHTLALTADGLLEAFGAGGSGQLGNGFKTDSYAPVQVNTSAIVGNITDIRAGRTFSVVLTSLGTVYTWGESSIKCLGRNEAVDTLMPKAIDTSGALAGKVVTAIAAGKSSVLVSTQDQLLFACVFRLRNVFKSFRLNYILFVAVGETLGSTSETDLI
jgi:alpha-tubulin suppressor-like RCC1 family protein